MKKAIIIIKQILLVLLSWGVAGVLLYTNHKLLALLLLITVLAVLTYYVYRYVSRQSILTAIVIMLILELLKFYNDYHEVQETGVPFNQFRIITYVMPFTVIFTVAILLLLRKNETKEAPNNKI